MGFVTRACRWVGLVYWGTFGVGCGQVTELRGGEGASAGAPAEEAGTPAAPASLAFAKSGDRVHALGYLSEGVTQFRTLHDALLDFDCEFVAGRAGADFHCVPKRTTSLIFLDAACSQPATWNLDRSAQVGQWVSVGSTYNDAPGQPPNHRDPFELGEQVYAESVLENGQLVYELQGTNCVHAFPPAKSFPAVNRLIAHTDEQLAVAQRVSVDVGGGLRLSRMIGADGSEFTVAVTTSDGKACAVQSSRECVPMSDAGPGPFPLTERVRLGSGSAHVDWFMSSGAGGPGVPVARYPEGLEFLVDGDERCQPTKAVDGTLRCARLSIAAYEGSHWADSTCTERLYYGDQPGVDVGRVRAPLLAADGSLAAIATVKVYDGPAFVRDLDVCTPAPLFDTPLLQLDQRVDATTLPLVVETTL